MPDVERGCVAGSICFRSRGIALAGEVVTVGRNALVGVAMVLWGVTAAFGLAADTPYQIRAIANLKPKDTIVVSNSGASSTVASPQNGSLCANVYALSAGSGILLECCSCLVGPDTLTSIPVVSDILANPKHRPSSVVLKVMASTGTSQVCNGGTVGTGADVLVTGMLLWKDQIPFTSATLSAAELTHLDAECAAKHPSGNTCPACTPQ